MNLRSEIGRFDLIVRVGGKPALDGRTHPLGPGGLVPEVNYLPCFENDDLPCRLHVFHVVCRVFIILETGYIVHFRWLVVSKKTDTRSTRNVM